MRNPKYQDSNIDEDIHIINLKDFPDYIDIEEFDLKDPKGFKKFIYKTKSRVRNSFEYQELISYLKRFKKLNECSVYSNVKKEDNERGRLKIELHHHPFTLEDIVVTVLNKRTVNEESTDIESVAEEVMYLHYLLVIGLIPLSKTPHEVLHGNFYSISMNKVFGNVEAYYNMYKDYMPPEQIELYENIKEASALVDSESFHDLFRRKLVKVVGDEKPTVEESIEIIKSIMNDAKNLASN